MNTVYETLYDIVDQRLQEKGRNMLCVKDAYLCSLDIEPGICDGKKMNQLDNEAFFQSAYLSLLNRLPDQDAALAWEYNIKKKEPAVFREMLIDTLIVSMEANVKASSLIHNQIVSHKYRELQALNQFLLVESDAAEVQNSDKPGMKDRLYQVYLKLPTPMKTLAHKILRRN